MTVPDRSLSSNVVTNSIVACLFCLAIINPLCVILNGSVVVCKWLYSLFSEFVMEDWIPEEDLYALSYPEMVNFVQPYIELQVLSLQIHHSKTFSRRSGFDSRKRRFR
uniref:Uncharacterized protein n=1 Tax=Brassica oleracea TaxID=3712 RepID=A0A3P6FJF5_BRAOL|nr:unnamed protein product [Brassica oleracea]